MVFFGGGGARSDKKNCQHLLQAQILTAIKGLLAEIKADQEEEAFVILVASVRCYQTDSIGEILSVETSLGDYTVLVVWKYWIDNYQE